ncbi:cyclic AMP-dependent transcription factor ATF-4 [Pelobates cultripes]|uniref:Cyclic AMP-dependent transcription factor ATF-4 n=1 Tax=Pelobates cultripes TaxID=61616 RepID=A0AAD1SXI4_PELCU|nr:cyclic AMP-dependent transcription factor ATF-4 [Pelobates cultripes]
MSLLNDEMLLGDFLSPFNQPFLAAEESLGLLDDCIEVPGYLSSHGFSSNKAKNGVSELLPLVESFSSVQGDAFSGMDWMVEKMDLKEFDFDSLFGIDDLESTISPDELMATLEDSCDFLEDPSLPVVSGQCVPSPDPLSIPECSLESDQVAPVSPELSKSLVSSPDHSFILDVGLEEVVAGEDKNTIAVYSLGIKCEKEDSSDNDSGISMSPPYLESPQQSPEFTADNPSSVQSIPESPISERPKPYDLPSENREVLAKVKVAGGHPRVDKKKKKMEQNKTAATRYRQKKRAEQEAISGECRELEAKNDALQERADSIEKEIQYLKDLIEEVRKAKSKRAKSS